MQENQQVVFLSDGGERVRHLQAYLHPDSEHCLDRIHIEIVPALATRAAVLRNVCSGLKLYPVMLRAFTLIGALRSQVIKGRFKR